MRTAIDTIAIEMIVPADDALLVAPLASMEAVADAAGDALADTRGDFDVEGFGDARTEWVGVGVGVVVRDVSPVTTTVPFMPAWIEQW